MTLSLPGTIKHSLYAVKSLCLKKFHIQKCISFIIAISAANKANEERLKRLQKSADLYKDRLGLEIRKIYGTYINESETYEIRKVYLK